jgi:hypothetical protein
VTTLSPREEVYEAAGRLVGMGVPWDAAWDTPIEDVEAMLRGFRAAREEQERAGRTSPPVPPEVDHGQPGAWVVPR